MKKKIIGGLSAGGAMLAGAGLVIGAGIAKADTEYADPNGYVRALLSHGINPYPVNGPSGSLAVGYDMCTELWQRKPATDLIDEVAMRTGLARNLVEWVVIDANVYLCPDAPFEGEGGVTPPPRHTLEPNPPMPPAQAVGWAERDGGQRQAALR
jgi:hypothetical protein